MPAPLSQLRAGVGAPGLAGRGTEEMPFGRGWCRWGVLTEEDGGQVGAALADGRGRVAANGGAGGLAEG